MATTMAEDSSVSETELNEDSEQTFSSEKMSDSDSSYNPYSSESGESRDEDALETTQEEEPSPLKPQKKRKRLSMDPTG